MSLLDILTGGKSSQASGDLEKALQAIQGVQTPNVQEMQYQIQKLVQAGVITPQQAQTYLQNPNAMLGENIDQTGTQAQEQSIAQLLGAADQGGLNPNEQAQMQSIIQQLGSQEKGANDAVVQNQAARGALTGGETMAAQLANNQAADVNANQLGLGTASNAYTQMLNELTSAGAAGQGLQGQQNTQANTVAAATNAINQFNAAQQQNEANLNTQASNKAQEMNLANAQGISNQNVENANQYSAYQAQLPQEVYQDQLGKAQAEAGVYGQQANQATGQGGQLLNIEGGIANFLAPQPLTSQSFGSTMSQPSGAATAMPTAADSGSATAALPSGASGSEMQSAGSTLLPSALSLMDEGGEVPDDRTILENMHDKYSDHVPGPDHAPIVTHDKDGKMQVLQSYLAKSGGQVPGKASVPGNSPKNDKVPALLSPGEVVLPRTVSQNPQPDKVMDFLNRIRKPKMPHPDDTAHVLQALGRLRGEQ